MTTQSAIGQAKEMPFRISKVIDIPPLEAVLHRLAEHKPFHLFGVTFQEEVHTENVCTAAEYCRWLEMHGALLEDPK